MRRCTKCGIEKPLDEFYRQKDCLGGYRRDCKACCRARTRAQENRWRKENPDRAKELMRLCMRAKPGLRRRIEAVRRARQANVHIEHVDHLVVLERTDGVCGICGGDVDPFDYHVDHVIPLALGGAHSYANTQPAHPNCNRGKGARMGYVPSKEGTS